MTAHLDIRIESLGGVGSGGVTLREFLTESLDQRWPLVSQPSLNGLWDPVPMQLDAVQYIQYLGKDKIKGPNGPKSLVPMWADGELGVFLAIACVRNVEVCVYDQNTRAPKATYASLISNADTKRVCLAHENSTSASPHFNYFSTAPQAPPPAEGKRKKARK